MRVAVTRPELSTKLILACSGAGLMRLRARYDVQHETRGGLHGEER